MIILFFQILGFIILLFLAKKYHLRYLTIIFLLILYLLIPWQKQPNLPAGDFPFKLSQPQVAQITLYQNIVNPLNPTLSRLYTNKATTVIRNFEVNFFESFDINHYFFANHPLERVGVKETEKLFSWLLPFFVIGLFSLNLKNHKLILGWIGLIFLSSGIFSNRYHNLEWWLVIPFLLLIGLGVEKIYAKIPR